MDHRANVNRSPAANVRRADSVQVRGVASRVRLESFPLMASRRQLQRFCDTWFNEHIPPEVAVFRPAFPIVFCTILSYDEIGDEMLWKTGALAQRELYFLVPLDRYRVEQGGLQFVEHCATTPYIFVDNPVSAITGRERFGFPKQDCRFGSGLPRSPVAFEAERLVSVEAWEPHVTGHRLEPLLEIVKEPVSWIGGRLDRSLSSPVVRSRPGFASRFNILWGLQALLGEFKARTNPGPPGELKGQLTELIETYRDGFGINVYSLRQFAHPEVASAARYQDLIRARMTVRGVQELRLFSERFGLADFSVLLSRTSVIPIAERLGLHVLSRQRGAPAGDERVVDQLPALLPWYGQADVELSDTRRLCWRCVRSGWFTDEGRRMTPPQRTGFTLYNTYLGPSAAAFLQPRPTDAMIDAKFMLLPARASAVEAHLQSLLPPEWPGRLTAIAVGDYTAVRVLVSQSRPRAFGQQEDLVWFDGHYASIAVPVECEVGEGRHRGLFLLHDFTDNAYRLQSLRGLAASPSDWAKFYDRGDWFGTTRAIAVMQRVDAMAIDRSAGEARVERTHLFDIYAVDPTLLPYQAPSELGALRDAMDEFIGADQPVMSFGSIPAPGNPEESVACGLTVTQSAGGVMRRHPAESSRRYYLHFHESETFPLVPKLGLFTVPKDVPLTFQLRHGDPGRTAAVPVLGLVHAELKAGSESKILWQQVGRGVRPLASGS